MNKSATELSAQASQTESQAHIRANKFDLLVRQSSPTPAISISMSGLVAFLLWDIQDPVRLLIWMGLVTVTGVLRMVFFGQYRKYQPRADQIPRWEIVYRATIFLYFLTWGLGGLWVMPSESTVHQLVVMYFLMGLAGSAVSVFSADRFSLVAALCTLLLPALAWLALRGDPLSVICALAGGAFVLSAARSSQVFSNTFTENLELTERLALARHRAEQMTDQVRHALSEAEQANEAKSRFFAAAHHDLRQPIQAARLMTTALARRDLEGPTADMVDGIQTSVETLSDQLDGFLEVSRLAAGVMPVHKGDFQLDRILRALQFEYTPLAAEKNITLQLNCPREVIVHTDHVLLERIIRNLLGNALAHNEDCSVRMDVVEEDSCQLLTIADTGRGIPADKQRLVFEEFYQLESTTKEDHDGLGLGLSIVQRLQQLLGLQMQMQSSAGEGTQFSFRVPGAN